MLRYRTTVIGTFIIMSSISQISSAQENPADCGQGASPMRIGARHIEPNGIGYRQGYTTAEGFFTLYDGCEKWVPFLDARVHVFNNGQPAFNGGLGTRYLSESRVWGLNVYYDYRKTHQYHYNQITTGIESLGKVWDFRLNGYAPVGKWTSRNYDTTFSRFQGHRAILRQKYEYVLGGANAEAAAHVDTWKKFPLYFAAGPYYLTGSGGSTWGGQARASISMFNYVKVEGNVSYDHLFRWIGQGQVGLSFSFGKKKEVKSRSAGCSSALALSKRAYQSVDRFEIIPVDHGHKESTAIDPTTGDPYYFVFVDNTSHSAGTFESPFNTLADAQNGSGPGNVIYVFPGDGTSNGMNTGIELQNYQRLWGSVVAQSLPTSVGTVTIPAMSDGGIKNGVVVMPVITNASDDTVVTVKNGNEISGFFVQNVGGGSTAIANTEEATDLTVLNCTIAGPNSVPYAGIGVTNLAGTFTVDNCTINEGYGIYVYNTLTDLVANISNSNFNGGTDSSISWYYNGAVEGTLNVANCTINSGSYGIYIDQTTGSSMTATLNDNSIISSSQGVYMAGAGNSSQSLSMTGNTVLAQTNAVYIIQTDSVSATLVNNNLMTLADSGVAFELDSNAGSTDATLTLTGNSIASQYGKSLYFNQAAGAITATMTGNTMLAYDGGQCMNVNMATDAAGYDLSFNRNTMNGGEYGFYVTQAVGTFTANGSRNTIGAPYGYGIYVNLTGATATNTIAFTGGAVNAYEYGVYVDQTDGTLGISLTNAEIIGADYAFYLSKTGGTLTTALDGVVMPVSDYGIYLDNTAGTTIITMDDSDVSSDNYALYLVQSAGDLTLTVNNSTLVAGDDDYTVYVTLSGSTNSLINMDGNNIVGYYPVFLEQGASGVCDFSFTNNTSNAGYYGLYAEVSAGTNTFTASGNSFMNAYPVYIQQTGGELDYTMTDNTLIASGSAGYYYQANSGAPTLTQTISGNSITAAGYNAITLAMAGSGGTFDTTIRDNTLSSSTYAVAATMSAGTQALDLSDNVVTNSGGFNLGLTGGTTTWQVDGNEFTATSTIAVNAVASAGTVSCMQLNNNAVYPTSSADAYVLNGTGAVSFKLNPPTGNTGNTNISLTDVTQSSCSP